jgi:hypothetical protein
LRKDEQTIEILKIVKICAALTVNPEKPSAMMAFSLFSRALGGDEIFVFLTRKCRTWYQRHF